MDPSKRKEGGEVGRQEGIGVWKRLSSIKGS